MRELIQKLINRAREIENERKTSANTAPRVGSLFADIILFFADLFQPKQDDNLKTDNKTVVGAINELNDKKTPDISGKQDKKDDKLETGSKTVVGAINELKNDVDEATDTGNAILETIEGLKWVTVCFFGRNKRTRLQIPMRAAIDNEKYQENNEIIGDYDYEIMP